MNLSSDDLNRLLVALNVDRERQVRNVLRETLPSVLDACIRDLEWINATAAPSLVVREARTIRSRIERQPESIEASLRESPNDPPETRQAKRAIRKMAQTLDPTSACDVVMEQYSARSSGDNSRHEGSKPLDRLLADLADIYLPLTGKYPSIGGSGGPFLRFVTAAFQVLSAQTPPHLSRIIQRASTEDAIRRRWDGIYPRLKVFKDSI